MDGKSIHDLAEALVSARRSMVPVARVADLDKSASPSVRRAMLRLLSDEGRRPILGYKVSMSGCWGALFENDIHQSPVRLARAQFFEPLIETELVFWIDAPITPDMDVPAVLARCQVGVGIEIADSRFADWLPADPASLVMPRPADTEADNGFAAAVVIDGRRIPAGTLPLPMLRVAARRNGVEIASGTLDYIYGHPAEAVLWLARALAEEGRQLSAGQFVFSGNPYPEFVTAPRGEPARFDAVIEGVGSATLEIG